MNPYNQQIQPTLRPTMNMSGNVMFQDLMKQSISLSNIEAVVEKRSSTNMFWNKRSITLIDGVLSYYSKVFPPGTDFTKTAAKASIRVVNIIKIGGPDKAKKSNSIQVTFLRKNRIKASKKSSKLKSQLDLSDQNLNTSMAESGQQDKQMQQQIVVLPNKDICVWEFAFTNPQNLKQFIQSVEDIKFPPQIVQEKPPAPSDQDDEQMKQKYEDERKLERERLDEEKQLRNKEQRERLRIEAELERQQQDKERDMLDRMEEDKKKAQENALLQQQIFDQKENERLRLLKDSQEHEKRQTLKLKLGTAWNYKFIQAIELAHAKKHLLEESVEASFLIHKSISSMKQHATIICKQIIDELVVPKEMKQYKPTQSQLDFFSKGLEPLPEQALNFGDDIYIVDGLLIKLAFTQIRIITTQGDKPRKTQIYDETLLKSLGNEFKCMSLLADMIEDKLQDDQYFPLRVPLTILIDYKGVRAFALALPPINSETQVVGLQNDGNYLVNPTIFEHLCQISSELNLKVHNLNHDFMSIQIPQSLFTEVHQLSQEEYLELRWIENDQNIADFAPQQLNLNIMQKCADLMPIYVDMEKQFQYTQRLRPEFLQSYYKQLSSDAFLANNQEHNQNDQDVIDACNYLRKEKVGQLLEKLEMLDYLPVDSQSLTDCFHRQGVNMRLLGSVCSQSTLPHIKQICTIEMVARVCKKVLRNTLADLLKNLSGEVISKIQNENVQYTLLQDVSRQELSTKEKILHMQNRFCLESGLDFFNLVLGTGQESDMFWKQILIKQVWYDYDYQINITQRGSFLPKGLLLQSLLYQCHFAYDYDKQSLDNIFNTPIPLKAGPRLECQGKCHYYKFMKSRVGQAVNHLQFYKQKHNKEILNKSVKWALNLHQIQNDENKNKIGLYFTELAEYHYKCGDIKQAEQKALEALSYMQQIHVHALNPLQILIKTSLQQNQQVQYLNSLLQERAIQLFEQSLQLLDSQLGDSHPIHAILYCILAHHYMHNNLYEDSYTLYKSGLISSQRVLGQSHPQTAQICTDIGSLLFRMNQKKEALQLFEQARYTYEALEQIDTMPYARNMLHLASLKFALGEMEEALLPAKQGIMILESHEFEHVNELLESYVLIIKIFQRLNLIDQANPFFDNIYGVLERNNILDEKISLLEFALSNTLQGIISELSQPKREWVLEMIQEMNNLNQDVPKDVDSFCQNIQSQVKIYQDHLNQFIQAIRSTELGSIVKFQQDIMSTIINNTERMINESNDMMDEDLKISVRLLESITFIIGPQFISDIINTQYS